MKIKAVIEVALPAGEHHPPIEHAQRDLAATLPQTVVIKRAEYVPEPEDLKTALKKILKLRLEGVPLHFTKLEGYAKGDERAPFFSEAFLYVLIGKQDARTVLVYIHNLIKAAGFDPDELEREVNIEEAAEDAGRKVVKLVDQLVQPKGRQGGRKKAKD